MLCFYGDIMGLLWDYCYDNLAFFSWSNHQTRGIPGNTWVSGNHTDGDLIWILWSKHYKWWFYGDFPNLVCSGKCARLYMIYIFKMVLFFEANWVVTAFFQTDPMFFVGRIPINVMSELKQAAWVCGETRQIGVPECCPIFWISMPEFQRWTRQNLMTFVETLFGPGNKVPLNSIYLHIGYHCHQFPQWSQLGQKSFSWSPCSTPSPSISADAMPRQSPRVLFLWGQWWACFTPTVQKTSENLYGIGKTHQFKAENYVMTIYKLCF